MEKVEKDYSKAATSVADKQMGKTSRGGIKPRASEETISTECISWSGSSLWSKCVRCLRESTPLTSCMETGMWGQLWLERLVQYSVLRAVLEWNDSYNKWQILPFMHGLAIPAAWMNIPSNLILGIGPELGLYFALPTSSLSFLLRVEWALWGQAHWVIFCGTQQLNIWLSHLEPGQGISVWCVEQEGSVVSEWEKRQKIHWEGNFSQNSSGISQSSKDPRKVLLPIREVLHISSNLKRYSGKD